MSQSGIYKITNKVNGKFYIGSSTNINKRWNDHLFKLRLNCHHSSHLQNAFNKYGEESFTFSIIEDVARENLIEREQYYLDVYKTYDQSRWYNVCQNAGNTLGYKHTERYKKQVSEAKRGKPLPRHVTDKAIIANTGIKRSKEFIENLRISRLGEKNAFAKLTETKVIAIKESIRNGMSQRAIAKKYGVCQQTISDINRGKSWSHIII